MVGAVRAPPHLQASPSIRQFVKSGKFLSRALRTPVLGAARPFAVPMASQAVRSMHMSSILRAAQPGTAFVM